MDQSAATSIIVLVIQLLWLQTTSGSGSVKVKYFCATSLTGSANSRFSVTSLPECLMRCAEFERKRGLIYTEQESENCRVIQPSCSGTETFMPQDGTQLFKVQFSHEADDPTNPVVYFHFETDQGWTNHGAQFVMEETPFADSSTVVKTDRTMSQWLDLGNQSQACITIPESCGMGGGTVSAWVKRDGNHAEGGVISSMTQVQTSFTIVSHNNNLRYTIDGPGGYYVVDAIVSQTWIHTVMVYHGLNQGLTVYHDGTQIGTTTQILGVGHQRGDGQLVVGKRDKGTGDLHASVSVDEIKLYNRQLTQEEICGMY